MRFCSLATLGVTRCPFRRPPPTGGSSGVRKINQAPPMRARLTEPPPSCERALGPRPKIKEAAIAAKYRRLSGEDIIQLLVSSNGETTGDIIPDCRLATVNYRSGIGRLGDREIE